MTMTTDTTAGLEVREVSKSYGSRRALDSVSFRVAPGELFGFVGSNGAGKTTTMRVILGVLAADGGEVTLNGTPLTRSQRQHIGYMPEERGLYPKMRVSEHLIYLARLHGFSRADASAAMIEWTDRLGLEERRTDEVTSLSLGNQQRVQLAAALIHDPRLLVLDEPFSGLDPVAVAVMSEVLRQKADSGVPVIFSSHQLELVEALCDRVGIIADGRMIAQGSVEELRAGAVVQYRVVSAALTPGWLTLPGARELVTDGEGSVVEPGEVDPQQVLAAALGHGPVLEFLRLRPRLTELYREAVAA
jgi:ABC-2 type transport system ATP-binding protein